MPPKNIIFSFKTFHLLLQILGSRFNLADLSRTIVLVFLRVFPICNFRTILILVENIDIRYQKKKIWRKFKSWKISTSLQKQYLELSYFFENALNSCLSLGNTFVYSDCLKGVTWTKFRWVRILHEQSKLFLCFVPLLNILILIFLNSLSLSLLIKLSLSNYFQAPSCPNLRGVQGLCHINSWNDINGVD